MPLDYEAVGAAGSMLGTKALQIFDETTCVVRAVASVDGVLQARVVRQVHAVPRGHLVAGADAVPGSRRAAGTSRTSRACSTSATTSSGRSFCALADGAVSPITSSIQYFRDEYVQHFEQGGCPFDHERATLFAAEVSA